MKKRKSEHHCSIQHIRISLDTKFQLKQTTLIFWNQIYPKRVFDLRQILNATIEFSIFE